MEETWKEISAYKGYEASNMGNIRSMNRKIFQWYRYVELKSKPIKQTIGVSGYMECGICIEGKKKTMRVHRAVAIAFIPNPENKPQVNHKDGDKKNNLLSNLEWATRSENTQHAVTAGLWNGNGKLVLDLSNGIYYNSLKKATESKSLNYIAIKEGFKKGKVNKSTFIHA